MENQVNIGNQNSKRIDQNPVPHPAQFPQKQKVNYWMFSTVVLVVLLIITGVYFYAIRATISSGTTKALKPDTTTNSIMSPVVYQWIGDLLIKYPSNEFFLEVDPRRLKEAETKPNESFALVPYDVIKKVQSSSNSKNEYNGYETANLIDDKKVYIEVLSQENSRIAIWHTTGWTRVSDRAASYDKFNDLDDLASKFYSRFLFDEDRKLQITPLTRMKDNLPGNAGLAYTFDDNSQNLEFSEIGPLLPNNATPGRRYYVIKNLNKYYIISFPLDQISQNKIFKDFIENMYFYK